MILYLKVRGVARALLACAAVAALVAAIGRAVVPLPHLPGTGRALEVPSALLLPALAAAAVAACLGAGRSAVEPAAARPLGLLDRLLLAALCAAGCAALLATRPYPVVAARNLLGFVALAVLVAHLDWKLAPAAPVVYAVVASVLGGGRDPQLWAWCMDTRGAAPYALVVAGLAVAALLAGVPHRGRLSLAE